MIRATRNLLIVATVAAFSLPALAKEPPAMTFVKAKCALCHDTDGRGNTPAGKQSGAADFKLPSVRNLSDVQMAEVIAKGKGKMPGFSARLNEEEIALLVGYVRELGAK